MYLAQETVVTCCVARVGQHAQHDMHITTSATCATRTTAVDPGLHLTALPLRSTQFLCMTVANLTCLFCTRFLTNGTNAIKVLKQNKQLKIVTINSNDLVTCPPVYANQLCS